MKTNTLKTKSDRRSSFFTIRSSERGATSVEYCLMLSVIALTVISIFPTAFTPQIEYKFRQAGKAVSSTMTAPQACFFPGC